MYDVSWRGSTVAQAPNKTLAFNRAIDLSMHPDFERRMLRVHDQDGETVLAEVRNGRLEYVA